jgi:hypothetical protein
MEEKKYVTAEELEAARLDVLKFGGGHKKAASRFGTLAIVLFLALFVFALILIIGKEQDEVNVPGIVICGVIFVVCAVFAQLHNIQKSKYMKYLNPYNAMYKTQFLPGILESSFDEIYAFEPKNGLSREIVIKSGIFPGFDYITTNDYFRAKSGDLKFEFCDMQLEAIRETTDSDGDKTTERVTVFLGFFIISEFDHFVNTPLYVTAGAGGGNVTTESEIFNSTFSIKCDSPVDALRILTPQMMNHILKIKELCKKPVSLAFFDDKIFFQCSIGRDLLEITGKIEKPISESRIRVDEDIKFIKSLLDLLNMRNLKSRASQRITGDEDFTGHSVYQNEQR